MPYLPLINKTALIGGASRGIGKSTALALANRGANVIALARSQNALSDLMDQLPKQHKQQFHTALSTDYEDLTALKTTCEHIVLKNPIHILINNSGGPPGGPLLEANTEDFIKALTRHLFAFHTITQCVVPSMIQAGYGRIINIISTSVKSPIDGLGVSNTTRGAVASWGKTLASELGKYDITVNNVLPGATLTGRLESLITTWADKRSTSPSALADGMKGVIPAGRFGQPEEIASVIAFLASPEAAYINGVNLPVDGGRTKCM